MDRFGFKEGKFFCEDTDLKDIAREAGTPCFVYSKGTIQDHYLKLKKAFSEIDCLICFSVKTNSNLSVIKTLNDLESGFDIVSGGELYRILKAGASPGKTVFAGVGKTKDEIKYAAQKGIMMFNAESIPEAYAINEIAESLNKKLKIALRVNPDVDALTHEKITTGKKENKFGIDINDAVDYYKKLSVLKNIELHGVHCHIGSQITSPEPFKAAVKKVKELILNLKKENINLKTLNIGGGLGINYDNEDAMKADFFASAIIPVIKDLNIKLILEPGRFIVGNAGVLVTRVIYVKKTRAKNFVIVDAAMNDLIRPTLYGSYHNILSYERKENKMKADIVGPVCESGDFFGKDREIDEVKEGDLIVIRSAGAYGFVMSSNYNSRRRAAEVMTDGGNFKIIRERETYDDLIKGEKV